ncbi:ZIP family metal transporter [Methanotorris igneus]|uniref:Zinc/iron permease n=1 Tax=Methanotorris igneus (strain DSM 5666 / JCM 11834 / Kol 5) TaxID=880724 RepID=F6BC90_METIK|nr:ZIP family metal transporter [Methanotorris igneus]AEF97296.1 zinc/iron permease [Methanotorris igneus Kol 5]
MLNEAIFVSLLSFVFMLMGELMAYYSVSLKYRYEYEAFSYGFILGVATLVLIPVGHFENSSLYVILGVLFVFLLDKYLAFCPLCKKYCEECGVNYMQVKLLYPISFFIHTFIDGLIIAMGFIGHLGLLLYLAILLHKLPAGFVLLSPLKSIYKNPLLIGVIVSFGTVLGTIVGLLLFSNIPIKPLISISGGVFIATFLLLASHVYEHAPEKVINPLILGFLLVGLLSLLRHHH